MEKLADSGMLAGVIDVTTTEICDLLFGGVLSAGPDRLGAIARTGIPYVGSVGALDMVNFWAPDTVPGALSRAEPSTATTRNVTLMRTTAEENRQIGDWIAERLNALRAGRCASSSPSAASRRSTRRASRSTIPEADAALFDALEAGLDADAPTAASSACRSTSTIRISPPRCVGALSARSPAERRPMPPSPAPTSSTKFHDMVAAARADHRRRRRHRPFGEMRGGRRHRPHHHLQFRPLPHGRPRLGGRAARLRQRQRDRQGDGARGAAGGASTRRCSPASTAPTRSC